MSGPYQGDPLPLSQQLIAYYRQVMTVHANDPRIEVCRICRKRNCDDYRYARACLIAAGELV